MRRSVRTALVIVSLVAALGPVVTPTTNAAGGAVVDEGWVPVAGSGYGWQGVRFRDIPEYNEVVSVLRARPNTSDGRWKSCTSITTAPCSTVPRIDFSATLQPCASTTQLDCVVEFGTMDAAGKKVPATYDGVFPSAGLNDYPAEPSVGLPGGGPAGLWAVAESAGVPVRTHLVRAVVAGNGAPGQKVTFTNFAGNISPVVIKKFPCGKVSEKVARASGCRSGDNADPTGELTGTPSDYAGYSDSYGTMDGFDCLLTGNLDTVAEQADCAERKALKKDVTYYMTVRLSQAVSGWMHGRLADPAITLEDVAGVDGAVTLSVAGKGVSVPSIVLDKKFSDLPATLQEKYRATGGWPNSTGGYHGASGFGSGAFEDSSDTTRRNRRSLPSPYGADAIAELEAWMPVVNDTAIADPSSWTFRTLGSNELGAATNCVTAKNKVMGIVTTNATQYKAGAPVYDSATKALNYTVSAPHYMSSGDLFKGAYSLIIRSDVARCIYGFTSAPISATVQVLDTGAESSTVVTNVSEADGWMKLMATGFTHSTPTIKSVFTQAASTSSTAGTTTGTTTTTTTAFKVGKMASRATVLKQAGLSASSKSKVTLTVSAASKSVCRVSGASVRLTKKGTCSVTVSVQTGSKRVKKTVKLKVA